MMVCMLGTALSLFSACTGLFGSIYDEAEDAPVSRSGLLYIDASSWTDWFYIDLPALADSTTSSHALARTQQPYAIPMALNGQSDGETGIYTYWFDVWGKGIAVNELRSYEPTDQQPAPDAWSLAVHRNNVRTNGGAVYETQLTDISQLTMSHDELATLTYTADEWTENAVWTDQSQMLNSMIGCQGIGINKVLSSWLRLDVPPMPPAFTHNNHVFVLRLSDGSYAALQLVNYMSSRGVKCHLTISYKYPL